MPLYGSTAGGNVGADALRPTGYLTESYPRAGYLANQAILTSATLRLQAVYLQAGTPVTALNFMASTTAAVTPTNQWAGLWSGALAKLAVSADQTTGAWAANTLKSFPVTYTPTVSGVHYVGLVVVAATVPSLLGSNSNAALHGLAPILAGNSTAGQTVPGSAPDPAAAPTANSFGMWVGVVG